MLESQRTLLLAETDPSSALECERTRLKLDIRLLNKDDISEVKDLFQDSFPITYPNSWYQDITSNSQRFINLAAIYEYKIVGIIVGEVKKWNNLNKDDKMILSNTMGRKSSIAYILSLAIHRKFRRNGIGSLLLDTFTNELRSREKTIKVCYLHTLSTNLSAILFYEKHNFHCFSFLPHYYSINGKSKDAFVMLRVDKVGNEEKNTIFHVFGYYVRECCTRFNSINIFRWIHSNFRLLINWISYNTISKLHFPQ